MSSRLYFGVITCIACMTLNACERAELTSATEGNWHLVWEDQFDGPIDENLWDVKAGHRKDSVRVRENVFTEDGNLVLRTSKVGNEYRTGFMSSRRYSRLLFAQKYGYFEARMKLDTAPGQWAAFWLMPKGTIHNVDNSGRDGTEIDIVEGFGPIPNHSISQAIHYDGYGERTQKSRNHRHNMPGTVDDWHTYGLRWCKGSYTWYVDNKETWKITDENQISQVPQYLMLTTEVVLGTKWAGTMDDTRMPADTKVDYIRVYKAEGIDECGPIPGEVR